MTSVASPTFAPAFWGRSIPARSPLVSLRPHERPVDTRPVRLTRLLTALSLLLVAACDEKPRYDDAPPSTPARKKAEKKENPREKYDHAVVCARLFGFVDAGADTVPPDEQLDRLQACRDELAALETARPDEHDCRCRCIGSAKDLAALERCAPSCASDVDTICGRAATLLGQSNDAGVLDGLYDECVGRLEPMVSDDPPRYRCFVTCYLAAIDKVGAQKCLESCRPPE